MAQDITETLKELQEIDYRLCCISHGFSLAQIHMLSNTDSFGPWYKDRLIISGSQIEGELYARMFRHGKNINESDYMFSMGDIEDPVNQLQPVQNSPGYFKVIYNGTVEKCLCDGVREKFQKFLETSGQLEQNESGFLTRSSVLSFTESMFSKTQSKKRANEMTADTIFQPQVPAKETVAAFKKKGPSVVTTIVLESDQKYLAEVRVDTVPCFKLSSWPNDWGYEEFLKRNRKWPSDLQVLKEIQDMVHIVAKPSPKLENESEKEECWRISFSKAEMCLKSLFSKDEKRVYLLFKILFYANIKNIRINGKTMPSYFSKTTMLWVMEEEGVEFCQGDLWEAIRRLFGKLRKFLESKDGLPNFFWPSVNLLEGYPQELITECSNMAENITQQPQQFLPSNFDEVFQTLKKMDDRLKELQFQDFLDNFLSYVREREHLRGCTAIELVGQSRHPPNWRVQFVFHPFSRAMVRTWVRRKLYPLRAALSCENCLPFHRHGGYETTD